MSASIAPDGPETSALNVPGKKYHSRMKTVEQIRRVTEDNLGIIFVFSPQKHILLVLIRITIVGTH